MCVRKQKHMQTRNDAIDIIINCESAHRCFLFSKEIFFDAFLFHAIKDTYIIEEKPISVAVKSTASERNVHEFLISLNNFCRFDLKAVDGSSSSSSFPVKKKVMLLRFFFPETFDYHFVVKTF